VNATSFSDDGYGDPDARLIGKRLLSDDHFIAICWDMNLPTCLAPCQLQPLLAEQEHGAILIGTFSSGRVTTLARHRQGRLLQCMTKFALFWCTEAFQATSLPSPRNALYRFLKTVALP
jgi:hypothetical protein